MNRRYLSATFALAALVLLNVSTAAAQAPAPFDHLKCYKITDSIKAKYLVDLIPQQAPPFSAELDCKLVVPAKLFCIDVQKTHVQPAPPLVVNGGTTRDFLCYKIACPQKVDFTQSVRDQFGQRPIKVKPPKFLCAPAVKVKVTPTPPAATQTPTPQPTHTPTCEINTATGQCGGPCPNPGEQCVFFVAADGTGKCDCQPPPFCTTAGFHVCQGPCPNPADICQPAPNDAGCICTHPCGASHTATPQCNGDCPDATEVCQPNAAGGCDCVQQSHPCGLSNGQCGGDCLQSDQTCEFNPAVGCQCVPNTAVCENTTNCQGACPGVPGTTHSHCQPSGPPPAGSCICAP